MNHRRGVRGVMGVIAILLAVVASGLACSKSDTPAPVSGGGAGGTSTSATGGRGGGPGVAGANGAGGAETSPGAGGSAAAGSGGGAGSADAAGTGGAGDGPQPGDDGAAGMPDGAGSADDAAAPGGPFALTSPVVKADQVIATKYRCGVENVSPPLSWTAGPAGTLSYAVTLLHTSSVHWVLWDIPASVTSLPEGIARLAAPPVPAGAKQMKPGLDSSTWFGYTGPCPQGMTTHYEYNVYALKVATLAGVTTQSTGPEVNAAILKLKAPTAQLSVMAGK